MRFGELGASLWLSVARCVACFVIAVAGKFASILICVLDSSCGTHSHNPFLRFCVFAFLVVRDFLGRLKKPKTVCRVGRFVALGVPVVSS